MDPHDDFDKHDHPPYDMAPATNTAYRDMRSLCADLSAQLKAAEAARDEALAHVELLNTWIASAVEVAAPFQDDPDLRALLTMGDSTVREGLRLGIVALKRLHVVTAQRDEALQRTRRL